MFQASTLARTLFLVSMRLVRMLGLPRYLVVWTIGHIPSLRCLLHSFCSIASKCNQLAAIPKESRL